jgi:hypothetical protein
MNADRMAIEKFVEAFETRRARWPWYFRVERWCVILCAIAFLCISFFDIMRDKPVDALSVFVFLTVALAYGAEKLAADVLVPLAREHLRSTSSHQDTA